MYKNPTLPSPKSGRDEPPELDPEKLQTFRTKITLAL
jgi:hypothetical protein